MHNYKLTHVKMLLIPYTNSTKTNSPEEDATTNTTSDNNLAYQNNAASDNGTSTENNSENTSGTTTENSAQIVSADNAAAQAAEQAAINQSDNEATNNSSADQSASDNNSVSTVQPVINNASVSEPAIQNISHTIKKGETLGNIANHYHVTVKELLRWNKINPKYLKPGTTLIIKYTSTASSISPVSHPPKHVPKKPIHKINKQAKLTKHPVTHKKLVVHKPIPKPTTSTQNNNNVARPTTT